MMYTIMENILLEMLSYKEDGLSMLYSGEIGVTSDITGSPIKILFLTPLDIETRKSDIDYFLK